MLVSVAFNFLGFVLTYLLHTTHAAKYGSRAGLGITLIQYGWALRSRSESLDLPFQPDELSGENKVEAATPSTLSATPSWGNTTIGTGTEPQTEPYMLGENAAAWLSFTLMTIGRFEACLTTIS